MPLLGTAAMLLNFDIDAPAVEEHDHWHTHEHLPERLSIPGFRRGTRWVAVRGAPAYAVLYEVDRLETLESPAYRERLDHPTPWTTKMMAHYRGMRRGLCTVEGSWGHGMGHFALLLRWASSGDDAGLDEAAMASRVSRPGLVSAHRLEAVLAAGMTAEQRLRGADAGFDRALLVTGYDLDALVSLADGDLDAAALRRRGLTDVASAIYRTAHVLTADESTLPH